MSATQQNSENESSNENFYTEPSGTLASGIVNMFEPPFKEGQKQLKELQEKQQDLVKKLHSENLSISEVQHSDELQEMFVKMKLYHNKLQSLKKYIKVLHDKSTKLKKRAIKLQQVKEKEPVEEIIISKPSSIIGSTN